MRQQTIEALSILLNFLRSYEILNEVKPTNFHLNGKKFIHFHDEPYGLWADIFPSKGVIRMPDNTASEQADVIGNIKPILESLESGAKKRKTRKSRTNRTK